MAPEGVADVVGRAAHEAAALFRGLVDLREGRFDEARGGADRRDHPHPEDGARAPHHDGNGDPGDVAHAHARGGRNAEGLEGRNVALAGSRTRAFREEREHFGKTADLHEPRAKGEPQTNADQHHDHDVGPQEVVDDGDELIEPIHGGTPKLRVWRKRKRSRNVRDRAFCFCIGDQGILPSKTQLLEKTVRFSRRAAETTSRLATSARDQDDTGRLPTRSSAASILVAARTGAARSPRIPSPGRTTDFGVDRTAEEPKEWHRASMRTGRPATCLLSRSAPVRPYPRNLRAARRPKRAFSPPGGVMRSTQACEPKRPSEYGDFDFSSGSGFSEKDARPRVRPLLIFRRDGACRRDARR